MMRQPIRQCSIAIACVSFVGAFGVHAQTAPATEQGAESQPESQPAKDPLGGLDELLGLKESSETPPTEIPIDPAETQLDRQLSGAEMAEAFVEAAQLMSETADRLEGAGDTGLVTQRLQEDVIKRLDILIEAAKQQQQQRSRSRSSSSSSQQQQQQQQQRSQANRAGDGQNRGEVNPPSRQDGALRPPSAALNATWGALPERVREALRQGQSSGFSSIYRSLTEAYYRRLAEEAGR